MSVWWRKEWVRFEEAWSALERVRVEDRLDDRALAALRAAAASEEIGQALARVRELEAQVRVLAEQLEDGSRALAQCASDVRHAASGPELAAGFVDLEGILGIGAERIAAATAHTQAVEAQLVRVAREAAGAWRDLRALVDARAGGVFAAVTEELDRAHRLLGMAARLREHATEDALAALPDIAERELMTRRERLRTLRRLDQILAVLETASPARAWAMHTLETHASSTSTSGRDSLAPCPPASIERSSP